MPLLALLIAPQSPSPLDNPIRLLAPSQQREDAELLKLAIESIHPGALRFQSKGGLDRLGREVDREASYAGDTATWYRAVSRYLAGLKCDHTKAEWPEKVQKWREATSTHLPFRFALFGKRAIVTHVPKESEVQVGDELLEVEGRRLNDVRQEISRWTSIDGRTDFVKDAKFSQDSDLMGSGLDNFGPILWGLRTTWHARFRQAGAKELKGIDYEAWRTLAPRPDFKNAVDFQRLAGRVAVLKVDSFINYRDRVDPVEAFRPYFAALQRDPGVRLILDLRHCDGGSDEVPIALLRYLCPQPVTWAAEIWKKGTAIPAQLKPYLTTYDPSLEKPDPKQFAPRPDGTLRLLPEAKPESLTPQAPLPGHYGGPLDVLVGPSNASGATIFLARLRALRPVRLVGQPTGGSAEGPNGGSMWFLRLPRSGITARIPAFRTETGNKTRPGYGVEPDIHVRPTVDDVLGKTDATLTWAIANPAKPT